MKNLFIILLLTIFTISAEAQYNTDKLSNVNLKKPSPLSVIPFDKNISEEQSEKPGDFSFRVNLYLWALSIDGSTALPMNNPSLPPQTPVADVKLKFSDAIKYVKMAAMLAGRFEYKNFGFLYDIYYVKLGYNASVPVQSGYIDADLTAKQFTGDLEISYKFPIKNKNIYSLGYAGARISSLDNTLDLFQANQPVLNVNFSKTWVDPIIGADATFLFSKHWFSYFKGDVGGFGISSKFTGMILGVAGYRFTDNWNATLGFKYLYMDYDKDNFLWKVNQYGLLLSFGYIF